MRNPWNTRSIVPVLLVALAVAAPAHAGKLSWLDDVVRQVVRETETGGKTAVKGTGRLFVHEADEGLETLVKRSDDLARVARRADEPAEAALRTRFTRLIRHDPEMARTFAHLAPAEQRLVVEMGETAQRLARRYPGQAEPMIRALGTEGLSAVRVYGDDVAEVLVKEGSESVNVLRKSGRGGWSFYTGTVLTHKKKLAAAGVLALFLANPDQFVDTAGQATRYAVEQFARAGIQLAGAVGSGASKGLESALGQTLVSYGINSAMARKAGMIGAALVAILATLVILGIPVAWLFRPLTWPLRLVRRRAVRATP
ncbi:MAG: hypothetical protein ABI353_18385 [Isosphaeraceae bacterium]